jgi:hypothetical protein
MRFDLSAQAVIEMIDDLFRYKDTVSRYDVMQEAEKRDLGKDGLDAVRRIPSRYYSKDELTEALTLAVLDR